MPTPQEASAYLDQLLASQGIDDSCPVHRTLALLSSKWRTHVIYELCRRGTCRFGELRRAIPGITAAMLTAALRDLEHTGIVRREQFAEIPPRVEYSLTEKGTELLPVFVELAKWGERNLPAE